MLLTCLQCQNKCSLVTIILGHTNNTSRHLADEFLRAAHITHIRATKLHGDAQALAIACSDVCPPFARCLQNGKISSHTINHKESLLFVTGFSKARKVFNDAIEIGLLDNDTSTTTLSKFGFHIIETGSTITNRKHLKFDVLMQGIGLQHLKGLGVETARHQHLIDFLTSSHRHHHRLSTCGGAVIHRSIGDVHTCEFSHHALIFKDIVQGSLRYLCLIGGIRGQELRTLQQTGNDGRGVVVIYTQTSKAGQLFILGAEFLEHLSYFQFAGTSRQLIIAFEADALWYLGIEFIKTLYARLRQHRLKVLIRMWKILIHRYNYFSQNSA